MTNFYTAESVTIGHPDKLCDLVSDTVLDACLRHDPNARVACEALATQGNIVVAGEITAAVMPNISECVRSALARAGYDAREYQITDLTHAQSPDIAAALNADNDLGAGDQGVMVGYATHETLELLPMPVVLAHRITDRLTRCRCAGEIEGLGSDGKAQVTVEYEGDVPVSVATVVVSAQHSPETDPDRLEEEIIDKVLAPSMVGMPLTSDIRLLINPSGRFVVGGPDADTGLTGRKLMVGRLRHRGGPRRRGVLRQGPLQGGPERRVHGPVSGEKCGGGGSGGSVRNSDQLRHWCRPAGISAGGYLWHRCDFG